MSMKNDWLEQNLEDRLGNKSSEFDMDAMWNEIQDKRTPKKDLRVIWIPFLLLGFFITAGLGYYALSSVNKLDTRESAALLSNEVPSQEVPTEDATIKNENIEALNTTEKTTTEIQEIHQPSSINTNINQTLTKNNTYENSNNRNQIIEQTTVAQNSTTVAQNSTTTTTAIYRSATINNNNSASSINKIHVKLGKPESIQTQKTESRRPIVSSLIPILLSHVQYSDYLRYDEMNMRMAAFSPMKNKVPAKANSNLLTDFQFGLEFTFGVSQRKLTEGNAYDKNWIEARNRNEKMLDQFSGAAFVRMPLSNQFYIHTGLEYQQYTAKLSIDAYDFTSEVIRDTVEILVDHQGMVLSAKEDDILIQNSIMTRYTRFQKYRSFGVPVLIGKNIKLFDKGQLSLNAGAVFSYTALSSGEIQSSALAPDQFISIIDAGYGSKLLMQASLGLEYHQHVAKNAKIFAGLNLRRDLGNRNTSLETDNAEITDKFNSYNLKLGWIKSF